MLNKGSVSESIMRKKFFDKVAEVDHSIDPPVIDALNSVFGGNYAGLDVDSKAIACAKIAIFLSECSVSDEELIGYYISNFVYPLFKEVYKEREQGNFKQLSCYNDLLTCICGLPLYPGNTLFKKEKPVESLRMCISLGCTFEEMANKLSLGTGIVAKCYVNSVIGCMKTLT